MLNSYVNQSMNQSMPLQFVVLLQFWFIISCYGKKFLVYLFSVDPLNEVLELEVAACEI